MINLEPALGQIISLPLYNTNDEAGADIVTDFYYCVRCSYKQKSGKTFFELALS